MTPGQLALWNEVPAHPCPADPVSPKMSVGHPSSRSASLDEAFAAYRSLSAQGDSGNA